MQVFFLQCVHAQEHARIDLVDLAAWTSRI